jgi:hypothetical protein
MRWADSAHRDNGDAWSSSSAALLASLDGSEDYERWNNGNAALLLVVMALSWSLPLAVTRVIPLLEWVARLPGGAAGRAPGNS